MRPLSCCLASCLLLLLLTAMPALAKKQQPENIDFGALTCKEFIQEMSQTDAESAGVVLMWLDGYLSGVSGDTKLNWKSLESFSGALMESCAKTPGKKVLDVAKAAGIN